MQEFTPTGFSYDIFRERYAFTEEETWAEMCRRVAHQAAIAETPEKVQKYEDKFHEILLSNVFIPGGRILYNSGRPKPQLLNCFVMKQDLDSKEGWAKVTYDMILTSMTGGGCGTDFSDVRPRGAEIAGHKGAAPGPIELMRLINGCGDPIRAGGSRRTALMFSLDLTHPSIEEFLSVKLKESELKLANISIRSKDTTAFIKAVQEDGDWELVWKGKYKEIVKARKLWNIICENAWQSAEPGFLNWELVASENPIYYCSQLVTTNPCIAGDTLIAVADGRNAVSIKQLTEEGKDVPVYSTNPKTGKVEIKWARNPRVTGEGKEVWKLTLDDGSTLVATPDHKILTKNLKYIELSKLQPGQSIFPFNSFDNNGYRQVCNIGAPLKGWGYRNRRQYRQIHEFHHGEVDAKQYAIHHKDCRKTNDNIDNLEAISHKEHQEIHNIRGDKNPMRSGKIDWDKYRLNMSKAVSGLKNGRAYNITNEKLIEIGRELYKKTGKFTKKSWAAYAKKCGDLPQYMSKYRFNGKFSNFKSAVIGNHKVVSVEFIGHEDVYNITVDDNHNYHVITSTQDDKYIDSSGICVKNCGELPLEPYGACDLGHLVLTRFVKGKGVDWEYLGETIRYAVRFLDNVLDVNNFPLPEMRAVADLHRRIGLGTTGLADMLTLLGYRYGSDEGNKFVDKLYRFISKSAYESSIMLAIEKGPFPACKPELHVKGGYVKRMTAKIKNLIRDHGIRNSTILTVAPTGTVSIVSGNCSSGIEPMMAPAYERCWFDEEQRKTELVLHPLFKQYLDEGKDIDHFVGSRELSVRDHMEIQKTIQRHIDSSVSKTINMPEDYPIEDMSKMWLEYMPFLKGTTFYRENSRFFYDKDGNKLPPPISKFYTAVEAQSLYAMGIKSSDKTEEQKCKSGSCEL